jgi:hypothetical protein
MTTKIKCEVLDGLGPDEKVAKITRADGGVEEVAVSGVLVSANHLQASEIARREGKVLVELPVESTAGNWRLWVGEDSIE